MDELPVITGISFRDKTNGWKKFGFRLCYAASKAAENTVSALLYKEEKELLEPFGDNIFMQGFLANLYLRPSCYACAARSGKSGSDISIADFWGVQNYYSGFDDDKGISLVLINSNKGQILYDSITREHIQAQFEEALSENPSIVQISPQSEYSRQFWQRFPRQGISCIEPLCRKAGPSRLLLLYLKVKRALLGILKRR